MCDYCHIPSTLDSALVKNYILRVVVSCLKRCNCLILCNCSNPTCSSHVYCPNTTQMTLNDNQPIIHPISGNIWVHFRLWVCNVQALVFCVVFCRSLLVFFSLVKWKRIENGSKRAMIILQRFSGKERCLGCYYVLFKHKVTFTTNITT
jgi:hypothetical protein